MGKVLCRRWKERKFDTKSRLLRLLALTFRFFEFALSSIVMCSRLLSYWPNVRDWLWLFMGEVRGLSPKSVKFKALKLEKVINDGEKN